MRRDQIFFGDTEIFFNDAHPGDPQAGCGAAEARGLEQRAAVHEPRARARPRQHPRHRRGDIRLRGEATNIFATTRLVAHSSFEIS